MECTKLTIYSPCTVHVQSIYSPCDVHVKSRYSPYTVPGTVPGTISFVWCERGKKRILGEKCKKCVCVCVCMYVCVCVRERERERERGLIGSNKAKKWSRRNGREKERIKWIAVYKGKGKQKHLHFIN